MTRTRNFRVRKEFVDRGAVTKSQIGKKACAEKKWEHVGNVQKEAHVVSVMTNWYKETCTVVEDEKDDGYLPHKIRRPELTAREKNPQKQQATEMKTYQSKKARFRAVIKTVKIRHEIWHPPVCQNYKSETGCINGRKCFFRHVEADEKPSPKPKKCMRKDQLHF